MTPKATWTRCGGGILAAATLALAMGALAPESDARTDPRIYALKNGKAKLFGTKASDWAAQWWQWALSMPVSANPLFDETGERVEFGQRGPVWFLGGTFIESGQVTRTATIPSGKALFFPILNYQNDNIPYDPPLTIEEMKEATAILVEGIDEESLFVTVDDVPVLDLAQGRVASDAFAYAAPEGNIGQYFGQNSPRGIYYPAVTDGYWVMLRPLPLGSHTVHVGGTWGTFVQDFTYNLTVVESNQP